MNTYDRITQSIIDKLEAGVIPWRRPWSSVCGAGINLSTLKPYRGINAILTSLAAWDSPYWLTYNQAQSLGAIVRKGEKGLPIVFFSRVERETEDGDTERFPMLRPYTVFNVCQIDNLKLAPELLRPARKTIPTIEAAEAIVERMPQRPEIVFEGRSAFYQPSIDRVTMPPRDTFESAEHFYGTIYHELSHSTGSERRLARKGVTEPTRFASHAYSSEELIAELSAAFLSAEAGIDAPIIDNSAAYLASWVKVLRGDSKLIVKAAGAAQRAADFILDRKPAVESATDSPVGTVATI